MSKSLKRVLEILPSGSLTINLSSKNSYRLTGTEIKLLNKFFNLNSCLTIIQQQELKYYIRNLKLKTILKQSLKTNQLDNNVIYKSSQFENFIVSTIGLGSFIKVLELIFIDQNFTTINEIFIDFSNSIALEESQILVLQKNVVNLSDSIYNLKDNIIISFGKKEAIVLSQVEPEFSKSEIENIQKEINHGSITNPSNLNLPERIKNNK